jgi:hypothetical protein
MLGKTLKSLLVIVLDCFSLCNAQSAFLRRMPQAFNIATDAEHPDARGRTFPGISHFERDSTAYLQKIR